MRFPDTGRFKGIAFITYATVSTSLPPSLPKQRGYAFQSHHNCLCHCMHASVHYISRSVGAKQLADFCMGKARRLCCKDCTIKLGPCCHHQCMQEALLSHALQDINVSLSQSQPYTCLDQPQKCCSNSSSSKCSTLRVVVLRQEEGYEEALKCDGTDLDGQQLRVQKCMSAGQHGAKKKQAPAAAEATTSVQQQPQPAAPKVFCAISSLINHGKSALCFTSFSVAGNGRQCVCLQS